MSSTFEIFEKIEKFTKNSPTRFFHWKNKGNWRLGISAMLCSIETVQHNYQTSQHGTLWFRHRSLFFIWQKCEILYPKIWKFLNNGVLMFYPYNWIKVIDTKIILFHVGLLIFLFKNLYIIIFFPKFFDKVPVDYRGGKS